MRGLPRRLAFFAFIWAAALGPAVPAPAAPRSAPTRSVSGALVSIGGIDYVNTAELARRHDLKAVWLTRGRRVAVTGRGVRLEFEADAREAKVNSLRVFMGEPARLYRKTLYISRIDAERFIGPMIDPGLDRHPRAPVRVVVLDAGHGGKDKGMVNTHLGVFEKTFALDVVLRTKAILERNGGFKVVLTRADDRFIELEDRPALAAKVKADVFVSVHFNSVGKGAARVTGVEVFSLTPQSQFSTDDGARAATAEARIFNPGNANDALNARLGYEVQRQILGELKTPDRGHKRQRFKVLRLATCPAILVEGGYLSNEQEARKIATTAYRQDLAEALARGIVNYAALFK